MNWRKVIQLAMVHVGVTITVVPITGTLNRIMIADMQLSALLVGFLLSLPYLFSPLQVVIGNWADANPVWGRHRSPWILLGGLMAAFGCYLAPHAVFLIPTQWGLGMLASVLVFTMWGMGVNIASVSYLSLVSELSDDRADWRSRAVSFMWTAMIVFIILTSIVIAHMVEPYSRQALHTAFGLVWMMACFLILVGSSNIEGATTATRAVRHSASNPRTAFRLLANNPTALRFFIYLLLVLFGIHAQDVLLEPFGAEVLHMPVAATSRLNSLWGSGLLLTLTSGLYFARRYGKKFGANIGAWVAAAAFLLIIAAGLSGNTHLFMASVFLLGLGGGLMTVCNLSFMLEMTVAQAAGLYIGAWGVADFVGRAAGALVSGFLRDLIYHLTGNTLFGYITVFGLEVAGLLIATWLFGKISVTTFRRDAEIRLHEILALTVD